MASPVELPTGEDTLDEPRKVETGNWKKSPVIEMQSERTGTIVSILRQLCAHPFL
jgi:hypothetical protein